VLDAAFVVVCFRLLSPRFASLRLNHPAGSRIP